MIDLDEVISSVESVTKRFRDNSDCAGVEAHLSGAYTVDDDMLALAKTLDLLYFGDKAVPDIESGDLALTIIRRLLVRTMELRSQMSDAESDSNIPPFKPSSVVQVVKCHESLFLPDRLCDPQFESDSISDSE